MKRSVKAAIEKRAASLRQAGATSLPPLVLGEEAGLPGLLVDCYGGASGYLTRRIPARGLDAGQVPIVQSPIAETGCPNVYERCDDLVRKGEGLPLFSGALAGDAPPDRVEVTDASQRYQMDLRTGFEYPKTRQPR